MNIVGFMVVGPGEADRYLGASLGELKEFCDEILVVANNVDPKTMEMLVDCGVVIRTDNREWGIHQPKIKEDAVKALGKLSPDWVISIDADEVFDGTMNREEFERLAKLGGLAWYFRVIDLWDSPKTHRKELAFWNIRFWRYMPQLGLDFERRNLHCGLAPRYAYHRGNYAPHILIHFGLMKAEDRARKVARYDKYDPKAVFKSRDFYDILKSQSPGDPYDEHALLKEIAREVASYKIKKSDHIPMATKSTKFFYVRKEDGTLIDIPERHYAATMKAHPKWELVDEVNGGVADQMLPTREAPVVDPSDEDEDDEAGEDDEDDEEGGAAQPAAPVIPPAPVNDVEVPCDQCDYVGKNKKATAMHASRVHKPAKV